MMSSFTCLRIKKVPLLPNKGNVMRMLKDMSGFFFYCTLLQKGPGKCRVSLSFSLSD